MSMDPDLQRLIEAARRQDRLYPIQSNRNYGFYSGHLPDGRQALVTFGPQHAVRLHLFDREGTFLHIEVATEQFTETTEESFLPVNVEELHRWLAERYGFSAGLIRIKQFYDPEAEFDIEPLPHHFEDFIAGDTNFTEAERERYPRYIREWCEERAFVLNFDNDYWLDDIGEVTSS